MKYSKFRRYLKSSGVTFTIAKGSHFKVTLNGKTTTFPSHGAKEMKNALVRSIKRELGIK